MSRYLTLVLMSLCFLGTALHAQNTTLNNYFDFKDGIYLSYEEFLENKPSIPIEKVKFKEKGSRFFNKMKITKLYVLEGDSWKKYDLKQVWGICTNGMPHIQYDMKSSRNILFGRQLKKEAYGGNFVRIRIIGSLCHFHIEDFTDKNNSKNSIYESVYGQMEYVSKQKILQLETGKICDFNPRNLGILIQDDKKLFEHFKQNEQKQEKIFLYLQKYNERNPSYCAR